MKYCEISDNHFNNMDLLQEMYCDSFYKNLRPNKINTSQMLLSLQPQSDFQEHEAPIPVLELLPMVHNVIAEEE